MSQQVLSHYPEPHARAAKIAVNKEGERIYGEIGRADGRSLTEGVVLVCMYGRTL